jgi:3'(2'), 5'-bisphosphate nucleotidase
MNSLDYNKLCDAVISISKDAGKEILNIYNKADLGVTYKDDNSPLTLADKASNNIIEKLLNKITPDIPILSEEGKNIDFSSREKWTMFWLIDPLDGTKEFIKRNGEFTVNIALISNGTPILGVVYAPVLDTTWYGIIDKGSYKLSNNKPAMKINVIKPDNKVKVVTSRSHANNPKLESFLKNYPNYELVKMGSSIKICLVADGSAHIYPRLGPTMEWDTAAAHAVVKYAGGNIYNMDNESELVYNKSNLLNPQFLVNHM